MICAFLIGALKIPPNFKHIFYFDQNSYMVMKILLALLILVAVSAKLVYLTELFRHGARYPTSDFYDGK